MELRSGIYEQVISEYFLSELSALKAAGGVITRESLTQYDPQAILSQYLSGIIRNVLEEAEEKHQPIEEQIRLCNGLIKHLAEETKNPEIRRCQITEDAEVLLSLIKNEDLRGVGAAAEVLPRPETSIAKSSLFTGSPLEPGLGDELRREIQSSNRIDLLISFIKWSGIRLIIQELREFTKHGNLRVISTSYTGATDLKAIEALSDLPNTRVKISYDTERTRLHAKTYHFHRDNGFSTAYIGSSNLSNPAITSGLEWNVKITEQDSPDILKKIDATFETYWNDPEFVTFTPENREQLQEALSRERRNPNTILPLFDIQPYYYQKEILTRLKAERELHNNYKNLIVAATGTGKTVISAFDYKSLVKKAGDYPRLLFVAHRKEILEQSLQTFRGVLRDPNFGDIMVDGITPDHQDHLFVSIQSFNSRNLAQKIPSEYYDMIIIDEFHHAAAPSYQRLLSHFTPKILLGLTATPERMDNLDILKYFNNRISAEIRLPEAINRKLLSPFHYFGVTDVVDLDKISWSRGRYDPGEISELYNGNLERVEQIIQALQRYTTGFDEIIGLGFCVSVEHANFMAESFNKANIPSASLHSQSTHEERTTIQKRLITHEIHFIFVVDLYNEGIDIPEINTILFLRPTESLTVFLQQLGRGLRLSDGKECLTVLDFVGRQNKMYHFGEHISALLSGSQKALALQVQENSYYLPKGCYIHMEKVAQERILENIKANLTTRTYLIQKIRNFTQETGKELSLKNFLDYHSLRPLDIYKRGTFCELAHQAGAFTDKEGISSGFSRKAALRLMDIDAPVLLRYIQSVLSNPENISYQSLSTPERGMLTMLWYTLYDEPFSGSAHTIQGIFSDIFENRHAHDEIMDLLEYNYRDLGFVPESVDLGFESPLELHCTYTRSQIFAALGHYSLIDKKTTGSREGVLHLPEKKADLFFITLNKTEEHYSPTTMYKDYAISEGLFHWQSQSTTSESSPTGRRYIEHEARGDKILLFVRENKKVESRTEPYIFLGTARYLSHTGSRPMSIVWELDHPMPPGLFVKANKMVVG